MNQNLSKVKLNYETTLHGLIFLFPLFIIGVRHWASGIFGLLMISGLVYFFRQRKHDNIELHRYERWYLWLFVIYFVVFLISMTAHFPERFSDTLFGNELRVLMIIPFYFYISAYKSSFRFLVYGGATAIFIAAGFCYYDIVIKQHPVFEGEYSQLLTGPIIVLYLLLVLCYLLPGIKINDYRKMSFMVALVAITSVCVIYTQVRIAYIAILVISVMYALFYIRDWEKFAIVSIILCVVLMTFISSEQVRSRFDRANQEFIAYTDAGKYAEVEGSQNTSSVGTRFEMWRASQYYLKEHFLIGVGNGNYNKSMQVFVEQGLVHPEVLNHGHPHNVFVNALMTKGIPGLVMVLAIFFFPLYVYIKTRKQSRETAYTGIFYVCAITLFSINEVAPFYKSNFLATNLILSLVIFQNHMRKIKSHV